MKQYGFFKATDFTKKQVGVVFARAKSGALKIEKWFIQELYNLADYYGYDDNCSVARQEREVKSILDAVFANDMETAQRLIDDTTQKWYDSYGKKTKATCDRAEFVK